MPACLQRDKHHEESNEGNTDQACQVPWRFEQLKKLDRMNDIRRKNSAYLNKNIGFEGIETPMEMNGAKHVYQMYTITLDLKRFDRIRFIAKLKEMEIGASVHFDPPVHLTRYYRETYGHKEGDFPVTERLSNSLVTLPMFPGLNKDQLEYLVSSVESALKASRK